MGVCEAGVGAARRCSRSAASGASGCPSPGKLGSRAEGSSGPRRAAKPPPLPRVADGRSGRSDRRTPHAPTPRWTEADAGGRRPDHHRRESTARRPRGVIRRRR